MKRLYKTQGRYCRYGESGRFGRFRSFATLKAAIRSVRLDTANMEADGATTPLSVSILFEHHNADGSFGDSEVVALWKRGRFVWVDGQFYKRDIEQAKRDSKAIQRMFRTGRVRLLREPDHFGRTKPVPYRNKRA